MEDKQIYISRESQQSALYAGLQNTTLEELQRLSGKLWTDFNPHDPGMTVAEVVNYALTELAYKLGFDLEDYITARNGEYPTGRYGMYPAEEIYPIAPVTADDYRKLILSSFPAVENVRVETDDETGVFHFRLRLSPFFEWDGITDQVRRLLHRYRNLCENVGEVTIDTPANLLFSADVEIKIGADPTDVLVQLFYTAMQYLSGSVTIESKPQEGFATMTQEEWYDGPVKSLRVTIPKQEDTETELYWRLMEIEGVKNLKTCYFYADTPEGVCEYLRKTDFKAGYTLNMPNDLSLIKVRMGREEIKVDADRFKEKLRSLYFTKGISRMRLFMQKLGGRGGCGHLSSEQKESLRKASYRDIYSHFPIKNDMPGCYKTGRRDFTRGMSNGEKASATNFGSYLELFDLIIERGLKETDHVRGLLSIRRQDASTSSSEVISQERIRLHKENDRCRDITAIKEHYLNYLDSLYGVDSRMDWLSEFGNYGESADDTLLRRMKFLRFLPELTRDRFKGCDIMESRSAENVATAKRYISLLMGFNANELVSVGNVLPSHNLILMGESEEGRRLRDRLSAMLIDEKMLDASLIIPVEPDVPPATEEEKISRYEEVRRDVPIFNTNWISGGLFREGIDLDNYKLVCVGREFLLVFRNDEEKQWMNLGRSDSKDLLNRWANTMRRYLQELNSLCEAVYIVEKSLFVPAEPFTVAAVFTGWTARTHSPRFREVCTQLVRSLIPAHLRLEVHWLDAPQMQYFEESYHRWRDGLDGSSSPQMQLGYQTRIQEILNTDT